MTTVGADRLDHAGQHDGPAHTSWRKGPATFRCSPPTTPARRCTLNGATASPARGRSAALRRSTAPAPHADDRRRGRCRQPRRAHRRRQHRQRPPGRHHGDAAPAGWQPAPVDVDVDGTDATPAWTTSNGRSTRSRRLGPEGTTVHIGTHGKHVFKTRVVDKVGNVSAWAPRDVWVDIQGPVDTTVVPTTWFTTPPTSSRRRWPTTPTAPASRRSSGGSTTPRPATSPASPRSPSRSAGDGVHKLEVRITDDQGRVLEWQSHDVKIDTVNPIDTTSVATGWLPDRRSNVTVAAPTRTPRSSASSGGSTAATSTAPPAPRGRRRRRRGRAHARDPRRRQRRQRPAAGPRARSSSTRPLPTNLTPSRPRAGATRPTRSCSTAPTPCPAWPGSSGSFSSKASSRRRASRHRGRDRHDLR